MPHKDPELARAYRKEYNRKLRGRDPEYQKRLYKKHRSKRLAAKKAEYEANREKYREKNKKNYANNKQKNVEYARQYRADNREETNRKARESHYLNRERNNARTRKYQKDHYDKVYAATQAWRKRNPDRELFYHAKRLIAEQTGLKIADVADDVALAKCTELMVTRWARDGQEPDIDMLNIIAKAIEAGTAETGTGSVHESAGRKDLPGGDHD